MQNSIPRCNQLDLNTPAELAIRKAIDAIEDPPADPRLTNAVIDLGKALNHLADYVDGVNPE